MTITEQIQELETELEEFRSGEKFIHLEGKISELEFDLEDARDQIKDLQETLDRIQKLIRGY